MANELQIAIFSGIGACIVIGAGFILKFSLSIAWIKARLPDREWMESIDKRLMTLEVEFKFWTGVMENLGKRAAKALHSPDDHLGIDQLLDEYISRDHEMTYDQWLILGMKMDEVVKRKDVDQEKKFMAEFLKAICEHKTTPKL